MVDKYSKMPNSKATYHSKNKNKEKYVLKLLKQENILKYSRKENVILILGNAKSRKSIFSQIIGTNDMVNKLIRKDDSYKMEKNIASSSRILPNFIEDLNKNVTFCDCPVFSNAIEQELIGTYFIKNIINSAHFIKLIFTVDFSSIGSGGQRLYCWKLVKHPINLVKNFERFNLSMAFVATNVDHKLRIKRNNADSVDNYDIIVEKIGNILANCKIEINLLHKWGLITKLQQRNAIHFIKNLIIRDKNNKYTRIGAFGRYEDKGLTSFTNVTLLLSNKNTLKEMIHKNLKFTAHKDGDFRYDVSEDSVKDLKKLIKNLSININKKIFLEIKVMSKEIEKYFHTQERSLHNIDNLFEKFNLSYTVFLSTQRAITECSKIQCFRKKIIQNVNYLNISISNEDLTNVEIYGRFLEFIASINSECKVCYFEPMKWSNGLTNLVEYLYNSKNWYDFLKLLDDTLGKYEVQTFIESNRNATQNLEYLTEYSNIDNLKESLNNILVKYTNISNQGFERIYDDINNVSLSKPKIKYLNIILDQVFTHRVSTLCNGSKLVIKGNYPMLSSVNRANCSQIKFIEILALKKFYIDDNLIREGDQVQLFIIAPELEIVKACYINLNGNLGISNNSQKSISAGDFVGISRKVIGRKLLSISNIVQLKSAEKDYHRLADCLHDELKLKFFHIPDTDSLLSKLCKVEHKIKHNEFIVVDGRCSLYNSNCINQYKNDGNVGYYIFITSETQSNNNINDAISDMEGKKLLPERACRRKEGTMYKECAEIKFLYQLYEENTISFHFNYLRYFDLRIETTTIYDILPTVLNDYKKYALNNIINDIREPSLEAFLLEIDKYDLYNTLGFVSEFQNLEAQFYEVRKNIQLLPLYESLLNSVIRYEQKLRNDQELTNDDKDVLSVLRTAILSKILIIKYNIESDFSRNLPKYLDEAIHDIHEVKNLRELTLKYSYNEIFRKQIKNKITVAKNLITNTIIPEIDDIFPQIENKIKSMFSEIEATLKDIEDEKQKLRKMRKDLIKNIIFRCMFTFLKGLSLFLFVFGPTGVALGLGAMSVITIAESAVTGKGNSQINTIKIPDGVLYSLQKIQEEYQQENTFFKEQLESVDEDLNNYLSIDSSTDLKEIKHNISDTLYKIKEKEKNGSTLDFELVNSWTNYKTTTSEVLKQKKDKLLKEPTTARTTKHIKVIDRAQIKIAAGQEIASVGGDIAGDINQLYAIDEALKFADMKIELLKEYENIINEIILPKIKRMEISIKTQIKKLPEFSKAHLHVVAWKIQNYLKVTKDILKRMTEGFSVVSDLISLIQKLQDGMTVIIDMYNHMEELKETEILANYIANITLAKSEEIVVTDNTLKNLKFIISSNLILGKYQNSINAFKHEVFPLAGYYLEDVDLPPIHRQSEMNTSVPGVIKIIENLKLKLDKYITGRNHYTNKIHKHVIFGCDSQYMPPFFVWKFNKNKRAIHKLLDGKEVILKSDIKGGINKNAIKFNVIRIRFSLADKLKQDQFDTELTNFEILIKHLGTSYYRCDNKIYKIANTQGDDIQYIFNKNCKERPGLPNGIYDDLADYHPVLSPYAMWSIQIIKNVRGGNFDELSKYKNEEMDLLLEGKGDYIDLGIEDLCNEDLSKYYTEYDTISDSNFVDIGIHANLYEIMKVNSSVRSEHYENKLRETRHVDKKDLIQDIDYSLVTTNGGCRNAKSSFINNVFNLIGNSLIIFRDWMPTSGISRWFINYKDNANDEKQHIVNTDIQLLNSQYSQKLLPKVSIGSADNESQTVENFLNTYLFCSNANLLFLDSVIRWKNGTKHKPQYSMVSNDFDIQYAQHLAYEAYTYDGI